MATTAAVSARTRLAELRDAAKKLKDEEWGDTGEMKKEAMSVHRSFEGARKRANATKTSE